MRRFLLPALDHLFFPLLACVLSLLGLAFFATVLITLVSASAPLPLAIFFAVGLDSPAFCLYVALRSLPDALHDTIHDAWPGAILPW